MASYTLFTTLTTLAICGAHGATLRKQPADIMLLLDASEGIDNKEWAKQKEAAKDLASAFYQKLGGADDGGLYMGIIQWGDEAL